MKPVWLLDVDGVLNAVAEKGDPNVWPQDHWLRTEAVEDSGIGPILYSTDVRDFIVEMASRVEIRWHTTWQELTLTLAETIGLPEFAIAEAPEFRDYGESSRKHRWWKLGAVERVVKEEKRNLIWTDDDIYSEMPSIRPLTTGNLFLNPNPYTGLAKKHLTAIRKYVDATEG